jgi:predicted helicase
MASAIQHYLEEVQREYTTDRATEHSYRPAFKALVESFAKSVTATNEPKRVACGAPDFIVDLRGVPIGFIECKDVGTPLDKEEKTEQLERYLGGFENLILTDYLEFRYYIGGERKMQVNLARIAGKEKLKPIQGADAQLATLFDTFLTAKAATITTPKDLAKRMANIAKVIRDAIEKAFALEGEAGMLHGELESFRATILRDITPQQFADMYAQTVCYGMFSARVNVPDHEAATFTREHAAFDLPKTNPFLREIFEYIAGTKLDLTIVWAVDLLADTLRHCDMGEILKHFGKATRKEDPVVHFYETFLAAYDPALRETRGVYYTPEPVVSYIVRSIDKILRTDFACPDGLADSSKITVEVADAAKKGGDSPQEVHRVQILDPATGTGTFLFETIRHIHDVLSPSGGVWAGQRGYVAQHLLPRLYGFELMMAPYAVAHLKLDWLLKDTKYDFAGNERLRVYLTNTLERAEILMPPRFAFANEIAREANAASQVKTDCPIMVIMGNPPYSGLSENMNPWVDALLKKPLPLKAGAQGYYTVDGKPLGEKKVWLQDDYVKFIRFAQYRIELTGYGVLGFITNHGYLDNPTFRGMRQSLMQTFDDIYVLDLHGGSRKKETSPGGEKDENVFDIQQGVAIGLFVKRKNGKGKQPAKVFHSDLWGTREGKYDWLFANDVQGVRWTALKPNSPHYFFVPKEETLRAEYESCPQVTDVFAQNVTGIVTARDDFVIDFEQKALLERMVDFIGARESRDGLLERFGLKENYAWSVAQAQADLRNILASTPKEQFVQTILYRPFDTRHIFYDSSVVWRTRGDLMRTMLAGQNVGLITTRATKDKWDVHATTCICAHKTCSAYDVNYLFPLYLYPAKKKGYYGAAGGWPTSRDGRRPNLTPDFVEVFADKLGLKFISDGQGDLKKTFGPEDVFHYTYATLHSPTYRSRYAEFLKIDFPRLPLTSDKTLFARLINLGRELVGLHLLERVPTPQTTYPAAGNNIIDKPRYKPPTAQAGGRVYVNDAQHFDDVPPEVWEFHVGGYQVCEKWLKDRKGRSLSYDDIEHYRKITEAVRQTIRLMAEIDRTIPSWPVP